MALFLVSYDLDKPGQNYDALVAALKNQGAKHVLYSAWALRTTSTSVQVRDWIKQYIDANDRILVTDLTNWASWNVMTDINQI